MIEIVKGDILESQENIIVHQVNCMGVMGGGLAKQIREKWLVAYAEYKMCCSSECIGTTQIVYVGENKIVANVFGQLDYGNNPHRIYTNYKAVESALRQLLRYAKQKQYTIAIPYGLGCGLGNGNWDKVYNIILEVFEGEYDRVKLYKRF